MITDQSQTAVVETPENQVPERNSPVFLSREMVQACIARLEDNESDEFRAGKRFGIEHAVYSMNLSTIRSIALARSNGDEYRTSADFVALRLSGRREFDCREREVNFRELHKWWSEVIGQERTDEYLGTCSAFRECSKEHEFFSGFKDGVERVWWAIRGLV